jgi:DNA-binding transcriptional LysR family regulator
MTEMTSLDHLRTFLAVYRAGSLTQAAGQLHMSQPAVSAHLKALEAATGRRLFVRLARGVSPTPQGHALARELLPHLDAVDAIFEGLASRSELQGTVYLGGPADLLSVKALPALVPLLEQGLRVSVRTDIAEPLLDQLGAGDLDLVLATRRSGRRDLRFQALFEEDYVLVGAPSWVRDLPAGVVDARGAAALEGARLVAFDEELPIIRRYFNEVFGVAPAAQASVVVPDLRGIREAVAAGAGISVLPRYVVASALAQGTLVELHRPARPPTNRIYLATRRGTPDARTAAVLALLLRSSRHWDRE